MFDGGGFTDELTRADATAASTFEVIAVPAGDPGCPTIARAIARGQRNFEAFGFAACCTPALALPRACRTFTEPCPVNPVRNLRSHYARTIRVNLNDPALPQPRFDGRR